eukprot:3082528-Prymnesium_polylepis.1
MATNTLQPGHRGRHFVVVMVSNRILRSVTVLVCGRGLAIGGLQRTPFPANHRWLATQREAVPWLGSH